MEKEIILEKKDYDFIDYLVDKYKIPIGKGYKNLIGVVINEYKLKRQERKKLINS